tara:strand:- start:6105 stop:7202 length:1098 start_codon:yes stop_codon:yes gene_type:complete
MSNILNNYNQLLEELMKLFPNDHDNITNILIMEDDLKLQSIDIFLTLLNDEDLYNNFLKRKIKSFSSKLEKTRDLSTSLFGSSLTLKNIFNNQTVDIKNTLWTYLHLIYLTKLLENKKDNQEKISQLELEFKNISNNNLKESNDDIYSKKNKDVTKDSLDSQLPQSDNDIKNPLDLDVNDDTNNMINDIINSFESKLNKGNSNPLESIMEITEMINGKYNDKINNGDIEIEKLLENVTGSVPGLDKMMNGLTKPKKRKETVIIDENFSTDDVTMEQDESSGVPDMTKMMGMFSKISSMTNENGDLDMSAFMNQVSQDNNMTQEQTKQMQQMMNAIDEMDLVEEPCNDSCCNTSLEETDMSSGNIK